MSKAKINLDPKPGSMNSAVLELLSDGEWHFHWELREALGVPRHIISATLFRLIHTYNYHIQRQEVPGGQDGTLINRYKLLGRHKVDAHPVKSFESSSNGNGHRPDLGTSLKVVGHLLHPQGVQVLLKSTTDDTEYSLVLEA